MASSPPGNGLFPRNPERVSGGYWIHEREHGREDEMHGDIDPCTHRDTCPEPPRSIGRNGHDASQGRLAGRMIFDLRGHPSMP